MITLLRDRVLIKRDPKAEMLGSIVIPLSQQEESYTGRVVYIGKWCSLKPGDKVLFDKYAGIELSIDGEDLVLAREGDIKALLR